MAIGTVGRTPDPAPDRIDPQVLKVAGVLMVAALAVLFDTTIVSVALHTLATELDTSVATIQWVSTGFLLALGVTVPVTAWAQARFGGKRLWIFGVSLFLIGSIACSCAWDVSSLIAFRIVQGIGGGIMLPLLQSLVFQAAGGRALGRTMSVVSLPMVLGPIFGPVLGGVILNWLDWRALFWVNVPFCLAGIILAQRVLPRDVPDPGAGAPARPSLDITGLLLLSPGIVGLLLGLSNASSAGELWSIPVVVPLLLGGLLVATFALRSSHSSGPTLVELALLRRRPVASGTTLLFLSGASLYGAMLLLPLYYQQVRGDDVLLAGLLLAPQGVGTLLSRSIVGRLTDQIGARVVAVVGFAVVGLATIPFATSDASTNEWLLAGALVVRGAGLGAVTIPIMTVAFLGLDRREVPHASILTRIAQQVGGSAGTALLAVILERAVTATQRSAPGTSLSPAFDQAFWWSIGFTGLAVLISFALPGRDTRSDPGVETAAAERHPEDTV